MNDVPIEVTGEAVVLPSSPPINDARLGDMLRQAYAEQSDGLMAKWLAGEIEEKDVWLNKRAEVKAAVLQRVAGLTKLPTAE